MEMSELRFSCGTLKSSHEQEQTERERTRHIHLEDIVSTNSKQDDLKQSTVNTELFYFLVWVFKTPNMQASIYVWTSVWTRVSPRVSSMQRELAMDLIKLLMRTGVDWIIKSNYIYTPLQAKKGNTVWSN